MKNITIRNFVYNGIMGKDLKGTAKYTADFIKWTNDPGIAECKCSDGKTRLIPSFAFIGVKQEELPEQVYDTKPVFFGQPSHS
jgi:hypothetical protein